MYGITNGEAKFLAINIDVLNYIDYISKTLVVSILFLFTSILLANYLIKESQAALLNVYFPLISLTWFLVRLIAILIVCIFLFIIFLLFNYLIPSFKPTAIYIILILTLFGGGFLAIQAILSIVSKFSKVSLMKVHGFISSEKDQPELFKLIKSLSKDLNSIFPDNIVLTSESDFLFLLRIYVFITINMIKK